MQQERLAAETAEEREVRLEGLRAAQQERLAAETAEQRETRLEGPVCSCLWLDLTHSVYFLCDILWPKFSYILMTHATAPCSARTLTQACPTMSCTHLVYW